MAHSPLGRPFPLAAAVLLAFLPSCASGNASPSDLPSFRHALLAGINRFRERHDLPPLEAEPRLDAVSQEWAEHLAAIGRLQHRSGHSLSSLLAAGGWETINENLYYSLPSPEPGKVLSDWEKSPFHRKNLLHPALQFAGLGRASATGGATYVVFNGAGGKQRKSWEELWKSLPFRHGGE